jgi:hypothetical protein
MSKLGIKAKTDLGLSLAGSGIIAGTTFSGPIGTIVAGTCSSLSSIAFNGLSKIICYVNGKRHEKKLKEMSNQDKKYLFNENDREIKGKITRLYVGWTKLCDETNHKISNLAIPLKYISPFPFFSDKLFYHASVWVQTDLRESSEDGILIEFGTYRGNENFEKEPYPYPIFYYNEEYGLRYLRMSFTYWKTKYVGEKEGILEDIFQHMDLYFNEKKGITLEELLRKSWNYNDMKFSYSNYNYYTFNCQHFVATAIKILEAKRYKGYNLRGNHNCSKLAIPKYILDSLEDNENDGTTKFGKYVPFVGSLFDLFNPKNAKY